MVSSRAAHNKFPNLEIIVNTRNFHIIYYHFSSPDTHFNLTVTYSNFVQHAPLQNRHLENVSLQLNIFFLACSRSYQQHHRHLFTHCLSQSLYLSHCTVFSISHFLPTFSSINCPHVPRLFQHCDTLGSCQSQKIYCNGSRKILRATRALGINLRSKDWHL